MSDSARDIMRKPEFTTLTTTLTLNLARVRVGDLGFDNVPNTTELCARIKEVGDLCPAEVGPHLRWAFRGRPHDDDNILVAMKPIASAGGRPMIFYLREFENESVLDTHIVIPEDVWPHFVEVVFVLRPPLKKGRLL